jgi:hypothetical protein
MTEFIKDLALSPTMKTQFFHSHTFMLLCSYVISASHECLGLIILKYIN